jgi:uncharacterized membrane protein YfcA
MDYALVAICGFAGGAVGGVLGVGGGIVFVPALVIFLDEPQLRAEATSLLAIVPVGLVGAWNQNRYGNVRVRDGLIVGALSPLGVLAGVVLANTVSERVLEVSFAVLVLIVAAQLLRRAARAQAPPSPTSRAR